MRKLCNSTVTLCPGFVLGVLSVSLSSAPGRRCPTSRRSWSTPAPGRRLLRTISTLWRGLWRLSTTVSTRSPSKVGIKGVSLNLSGVLQQQSQLPPNTAGNVSPPPHGIRNPMYSKYVESMDKGQPNKRRCLNIYIQYMYFRDIWKEKIPHNSVIQNISDKLYKMFCLGTFPEWTIQ